MYAFTIQDSDARAFRAVRLQLARLQLLVHDIAAADGLESLRNVRKPPLVAPAKAMPVTSVFTA